MSAGAFRCGHPDAPGNWAVANSGVICRRCKNATAPTHDKLIYRIRYLPGQIERARRKLAALENEARRYGMHDLIGGRS